MNISILKSAGANIAMAFCDGKKSLEKVYNYLVNNYTRVEIRDTPRDGMNGWFTFVCK